MGKAGLMKREEAMGVVLDALEAVPPPTDYDSESSKLSKTPQTKARTKTPIVATTGFPGRELYELREKFRGEKTQDFLCVGSMGHASSIALGVLMGME